jgi:membrane fusion protein (multidrug efflux system)
MRIGQKARVRSDIYGSSVTYDGVIVGIGGGTGSVFSLLPPQNATGNWIKITQRLPVRIALNQTQVKKYPLRLGLSMEVTVDLKDQRGVLIPQPLGSEFLYETNVFDNQEDGSDAIIQQILEQNIPESYLR